MTLAQCWQANGMEQRSRPHINDPQKHSVIDG